MNVVKCMNGHFFDGDTYPNCPHCGAQAGSSQSPGSVAGGKISKGGLFGKFKEKSKTVQQAEKGTNRIPDVQQTCITQTGVQKGNASVVGTSVTGVMTQKNQIQDSLSNEPEKNPTLDFWQASAKDDKEKDGNPQEEILNDNPALHEQNDLSDETNELSSGIELSENTSTKEKAHQPSLTDTIKKASANSEGKTMSYFSSMTDKTANLSPKAVMSDPVVGWLVSVCGNHFGESFQIGAGKNSVGRNDDNRIILSMDNAVSRSKHAIITYEPKKRNFYIQPGDSSGLTYLNDEYITETKQLHSRDMIEIGDSKLIFIPLCGDEFTWEDFIAKE